MLLQIVPTAFQQMEEMDRARNPPPEQNSKRILVSGLERRSRAAQPVKGLRCSLGRVSSHISAQPNCRMQAAKEA